MLMFDGRTTSFRACVVWYGHVVFRAFFQFSPKSAQFSEFVQLSTVSVWIFIKNRPRSFHKYLTLRSLTFVKTLINQSLLIEINWNLFVDLTQKKGQNEPILTVYRTHVKSLARYGCIPSKLYIFHVRFHG